MNQADLKCSEFQVDLKSGSRSQIFWELYNSLHQLWKSFQIKIPTRSECNKIKVTMKKSTPSVLSGTEKLDVAYSDRLLQKMRSRD